MFVDMRAYVFRVTTHLENLEKSGNSKVVRENEIRCVFSSCKYTPRDP